MKPGNHTNALFAEKGRKMKVVLVISIEHTCPRL
jgi:hypothetical protein